MDIFVDAWKFHVINCDNVGSLYCFSMGWGGAAFLDLRRSLMHINLLRNSENDLL
jgi:hypothetical protein